MRGKREIGDGGEQGGQLDQPVHDRHASALQVRMGPKTARAYQGWLPGRGNQACRVPMVLLISPEMVF